MTLNAAELVLIDRWQRDFPLTARPFALVGRSVGFDENETIETLARLRENGVISRIGAVVRPHTVGASTLAAIRVPADRIEEVAARVSAEPLVNHNYEREHAFNLWFVATGVDIGAVRATIERIEWGTGLAVIDLPLVKAYRIDLGFPLTYRAGRDAAPARNSNYRSEEGDRILLAGIEDGLPLEPRPYREVAHHIGRDESEVIKRLKLLTAAGIVTRFGCVVRHRALGYDANAMAVWDMPDAVIDAVASDIAKNPHVTLCYRRPRRLPDWPYNLFCMVHAKTRSQALAAIEGINAATDAGRYSQAVLFSTRCFKQRGALFADRRSAS